MGTFAVVFVAASSLMMLGCLVLVGLLFARSGRGQGARR